MVVNVSLSARADDLHQEATVVLAALNVPRLLEDVGPVAVMGSHVSGLMVWRDLHVGVLTPPGFSPTDVLQLMTRVVTLPGVTGFVNRDERGAHCLTGQRRDERYHVPFEVEWGDALWCVDLTLWVHDLHTDVAVWHECSAIGSTVSSARRRWRSRMSGTAARSTRTRSGDWKSIRP